MNDKRRAADLRPVRFDTGFDHLDSEHDALVVMFDRVESALRDQAVSQDALQAEIRRLVRFTEQHLAHEEALMASIDYPDEDDHVKEHRILLEETNRLINEVQAAKDMKYVMPPLKQLRRSTERHITELDVGLARAVLDQRGNPDTETSKNKIAKAVKRVR